MGIQHKIGADIMFAFDELTTLMNTRSYQEDSVDAPSAGPADAWTSTSG